MPKLNLVPRQCPPHCFTSIKNCDVSPTEHFPAEGKTKFTYECWSLNVFHRNRISSGPEDVSHITNILKYFCSLLAKQHSIAWNSHEMNLISLTDFELLDSSQVLLSTSVITKWYRFVFNMAGFTGRKMFNAKELNYVRQNGVSGVAEYISSKPHDWENVVIHFAVCGVSVAGKSTFINRIRR